MRIVVIGAGVVGVSTAYELAHDGHEVVVVDRQPEPGLETSFANAGQLVPGHSEPWAAPGVWRLLLRWLGRPDAPLLIRPRLDPALAAWGLRFLANTRRKRFEANLHAAVRLGVYGRDMRNRVLSDTGIDCGYHEAGSLNFHWSQKSLDAAAGHAELMTELGCPTDVLDARGCVEAEPSLAAVADRIAGGTLCRIDGVGDAQVFTAALAERCSAAGVDFRYGVTVRAAEQDGERVTAVNTDEGPLEADAFVVAMGSYSAPFARMLRVRLPVYPAKGYSITMPLADEAAAPRMGLLDAQRKIALTRLGDRLRVAGTAEFAGFDWSDSPARTDAIAEAAREVLPDAAYYSRIVTWNGLRAATPDHLPVLGPARYPNLHFNTGHTSLGWTNAAGTARIVADLISGRTPAIDPAPYSIERFRRL